MTITLSLSTDSRDVREDRFCGKVWVITDGDGVRRGTVWSSCHTVYRRVSRRPGSWRLTPVVESYYIELEGRVSGYPRSWRERGSKGPGGDCREFEVVPGELFTAGTTTSHRTTSAFASIRRTLREVIGS